MKINCVYLFHIFMLPIDNYEYVVTFSDIYGDFLNLSIFD